MSIVDMAHRGKAGLKSKHKTPTWDFFGNQYEAAEKERHTHTQVDYNNFQYVTR